MQVPNSEEYIQGTISAMRRMLDLGRFVPFVGAGASIGARITGSKDLTLPSGAELAYQLAERYGLSEKEVNVRNLLEVASAGEVIMDKRDVERQLERVFTAPAEPMAFHRWLAAQSSIHLIVTTNYDGLIEQACREAGRDFHVMMPAPREKYRRDFLMWWQPSAAKPIVERVKRVDLDPRASLVIYKMHGGVDPTSDWQSSVTTEEDYFDAACRVCDESLFPGGLVDVLSRSSLVFVGYSLRDVHVRRLLYQMERLIQQRHYVVNKFVRGMDAARLQTRRFEVLEMSAEDFIKILQSNDGI